MCRLGVKFTVTEQDLTLDGEHTIQCVNDVLQNSILETYLILLFF